MQKIPAYQLAVSDSNKDIALNGPKTWDKTRLFFIAKDLNVIDNLVALSKPALVVPTAHMNWYNTIELTNYKQSTKACMTKTSTMTLQSPKWPTLLTKLKKMFHPLQH